MYSEWAVVEFSHLNVEDVEAGTELIEFDLGEARFVKLYFNTYMLCILTSTNACLPMRSNGRKRLKTLENEFVSLTKASCAHDEKGTFLLIFVRSILIIPQSFQV